MRPGNSIFSPPDATLVRLQRPDDVEGFLAQAQAHVSSTPPERILWSCGEEMGDLFAGPAATAADASPAPAPSHSAPPAAFVDLAHDAALHSDPTRFALLYELLWRLRRDPALLAIASDPQVIRARELAKAVRRDLHKMKAFVRFRRIIAPDGEDAFIAWFEPAHHIVAAAAPFFMRRFANMRWSILCPRASAHWDGSTLTLGAGADKSAAPSEDALEAAWRIYYASIFNPTRLKVKAMTAQMPKKYWRNLPEATLIAPLIRDAQARATQMIAAAPTQPSRYAEKATALLPLAPAQDQPSLAALCAGEAACARCSLSQSATQAVPGEGPGNARVMLVGEQPGDQEDLAGRPFVGPAGKLLDIALERAGVARDRCFVTNAVKHFKFEPRGKRRLHKTPAASEVDACRWWLDQERALLRPGLIVALGATAIRGVTGRATPVSALRGRFIEIDAATQFFVTVHPSSLLRLQDETQKRAAWRGFLDDLSLVADWMRRDAA